MRKLLFVVCALLLVSVAASGAETSPSPLPSPPLIAPRHVIIDNPQPQPQVPAAAYFPSGQITGVWQGCGPSQSMGTIEDFNSDHPRARIVQVFVDASVPCKTPTAHTFVIVYQEPAPMIKRTIRQPMKK